MAYRPGEMLARQRTQLINALRGHLTEFGVVVAPQGTMQIKKLAAASDAPEAEFLERARPRTLPDTVTIDCDTA